MSIVGDFFDDVTNNPLEFMINPIVGGTGSVGNSLLGGSGSGQGEAYLQAMREYNAMMKEEMEANRAWQKDFAQQGTGWMLDDAKSRGLSPMAAIGGRAPVYQPVRSGRQPIMDGQKSSKYGNVMSSIMQGLQIASMIAGIKSTLATANFMNARAGAENSGPQLYGDGQMDGLRPDNLQTELQLPLQTAPRAGSKSSMQAGSFPTTVFRTTPYGLAYTTSDPMTARTQGNVAEMMSYGIEKGKRFVHGPESNERPSLKTYPLPKGQVWKWDDRVIAKGGKQWRPWDVKRKRYALYSRNKKAIYPRKGFSSFNMWKRMIDPTGIIWSHEK